VEGTGDPVNPCMTWLERARVKTSIHSLSLGQINFTGGEGGNFGGRLSRRKVASLSRVIPFRAETRLDILRG